MTILSLVINLIIMLGLNILIFLGFSDVQRSRGYAHIDFRMPRVVLLALCIMSGLAEYGLATLLKECLVSKPPAVFSAKGVDQK